LQANKIALMLNAFSQSPNQIEEQIQSKRNSAAISKVSSPKNTNYNNQQNPNLNATLNKIQMQLKAVGDIEQKENAK